MRDKILQILKDNPTKWFTTKEISDELFNKTNKVVTPGKVRKLLETPVKWTEVYFRKDRKQGNSVLPVNEYMHCGD